MLFVTILSKEVSSTGSIPGENEWTPTHGAAPTQCAPKMTPMLLSQPPIPAPAAKTFSETISISQSIIPNSSTIFSSRLQTIFSILIYWKLKNHVSSFHRNLRSEKTFATESTRSLDAFSQWTTQESKKWSSIN